MTDVRLVDVSLRDGNQSVWGAVGVRTRTIEKMAPLLDKVGYHAIELLTSTQFAVAVRFHKEDPWQRIDRARALAPNSTLGFLTTGRRFISFSQTPPNLLRLAYELLRRHGVTRMWVIDPMHDMSAAMENARVAKEVGFDEVVVGACYTISPVHTDEYYADKVAQLDDCPHVDSIYVKDPAGLLTPQKLETLVPKMRSRLKRLKIEEIHSHCNTGLAPITLLTAADLGMTILHCALPPVANGSSHPSGLQLVRNLAARGHTTNVDLEAMEAASACLTREADLFDLPHAVQKEYDEAYYHHTLPGGVLTTMKRQLTEMGKVDLYPKAVEEAIHVRADLGWPIVVTPFAQYIVTQATMNVLSGERYSHLTDEVIDLLLGDFGPMPGPVDQNLLDRAKATSRAKSKAGKGIEHPSLDQLRKSFPSAKTDEDLLLRALMPENQVDAMAAARAQTGTKSLNELMAALDDPKRPMSVAITQDGSTMQFAGAKTASGGASG